MNNAHAGVLDVAADEQHNGKMGGRRKGRGRGNPRRRATGAEIEAEPYLGYLVYLVYLLFISFIFIS